MNAIGIFAGRGDVLVAMWLACMLGTVIGWYGHRFVRWLLSLRRK